MELERAQRKNSPGSWVRSQVLVRVLGAAVLIMGVVGYFAGFVARGASLAGSTVEHALLAIALPILVGVVLLGALWRYFKHLEATWLRGLDAEQRVGDRIEHALTQKGCAFAHDVKEALGGRGNVDHIAMTPTGVWVIETKARWLAKDKFKEALKQTAANVRRVRGHLRTDLPVRGALVIADPSLKDYEADDDWHGEPIMCLDAKSLWELLRKERRSAGTVDDPDEVARVRELVWNLGSVAHVAA